MLKDFLKQTCSIIQKTRTKVGGEYTVSETNLYTSIPCYLYNLGGNLNATDLSENTVIATHKLIVEGSKTSIRVGMVALVDSQRYEIVEAKANTLINGKIDSIQMKVKAI